MYKKVTKEDHPTLSIRWPRCLKAWVARSLACWDYGFESRRVMSLVNVVCCQVEVCASG
jgi:hypothetical protein